MKEAAFDLNLLSVVVALDEMRSVTRAAHRLGMSQPGLSTALKRLREHFGDPMFVRTTEGMRPTARGVTVAEEARAILQRLDAHVLQAPCFVPAETRTQWRFSMPDVGEICFLPSLLAALSTLAPHATLYTSSQEPARLEQAMESGQVDLALGYYPDLKSNRFFKQQLMVHGFSCMLRAGHPAASCMTQALYSELEHVVVETPIRSQELADYFLERRKVFRRIRLRTPHFLTLPQLVAQSDLVATVPTALASLFARQGLVQLVEPPYALPRFPIQLHWHRRYDKDPRNQWLRAQVQHLFGPQSGWSIQGPGLRR